jgi:hypothetical protein
MKYAKFWAAIVGVAATTALGLIPPNSTIWIILTILSAALTAIAVRQVPNAEQ